METIDLMDHLEDMELYSANVIRHALEQLKLENDLELTKVFFNKFLDNDVFREYIYKIICEEFPEFKEHFDMIILFK